MTSTEARTRVKFKFGIPSTVTTFDDDIDESVSAAIDVLAPYLSGVPQMDESLSLASGQNELTWIAVNDSIERIWYRTTSSSDWILTTDWYVIPATAYEDGRIIFTESFGTAVDLRILMYAPHRLVDIALFTATQITPLIDFACSEFASMLAGSKSHFNAYSQTSGARGVDSMTDLSNFYEGRAMARAERIADAEGLL